MMEATTGVWAAGGTGFSLETLFEVARLEEKEARRIFPGMDWLLLLSWMLPLYTAQ